MTTCQKPPRHPAQSLGKIYTTKRQPLSEISFYPKSAFIDHYYLDSLHGNAIQTKSKVINFVGDQSANIKTILDSLDALNYAEHQILTPKLKRQIGNEFNEILVLFYQKIHKMRHERNTLKNSLETQHDQHANQIRYLQTQIQQLNQQIVELKKQKSLLLQKLENESKKKLFFQRQNLILQENNKISTISSPQFLHTPIQHPTYLSQIYPNEPSLLDSYHKNQFQKPQTQTRHSHFTDNTINTCKVPSSNKSTANSAQHIQTLLGKLPQDESQMVQKMLLKYNLSHSQLEDLIADYFHENQQNPPGQLQTLQKSLSKKTQPKLSQNKSLKHSHKLNHVNG